RRQFCVAFDDPRFAPNLDATPMRIVDQEKVGFGIVRKIALRDKLPVTRKVDKADGLVIEDMQETGRPAAVLNIRLSFCARSGEKNTRLRLDEGGKIGANTSLP